MRHHLEPTALDDDPQVAEMRRTFDQYVSSGRSARWAGRELGARLATDERDRWLVGAAQSHALGSVADLGCGDANVALAFARAGVRPRRYVGVDIIESRLSLAASRYPEGEYILASATAVPMEDSTIDLVVACVLFSSLLGDSTRTAAASEIRRLLRPGGRALIYDLRYPSPGNSAVRAFAEREVRNQFEGWAASVTTMTLLPPLARMKIAASQRRYNLLTRIPLLRSHVGVALTKPS